MHRLAKRSLPAEDKNGQAYKTKLTDTNFNAQISKITVTNTNINVYVYKITVTNTKPCFEEHLRVTVSTAEMMNSY